MLITSIRIGRKDVLLPINHNYCKFFKKVKVSLDGNKYDDYKYMENSLQNGCQGSLKTVARDNNHSLVLTSDASILIIGISIGINGAFAVVRT